ncbi:hypothetical protein llap_19516 [Limosa lapponica baueri]|uniref:Uncharacterized protein n=1 Tax=Limosa lapponica baueri TaxID=1758121 RepID=A0A2I0T8P8_LIMLA|nr:hypothetical protein llap_19516 [Limosa lapponica baueri]
MGRDLLVQTKGLHLTAATSAREEKAGMQKQEILQEFPSVMASRMGDGGSNTDIGSDKPKSPWRHVFSVPWNTSDLTFGHLGI